MFEVNVKNMPEKKEEEGFSLDDYKLVRHISPQKIALQGIPVISDTLVAAPEP